MPNHAFRAMIALLALLLIPAAGCNWWSDDDDEGETPDPPGFNEDDPNDDDTEHPDGSDPGSGGVTVGLVRYDSYPAVCQVQRIPAEPDAAVCEAAGTSTCDEHADCQAGPGGRCQVGASGACGCVYHQCYEDADCAAYGRNAQCYCAGTLSPTGTSLVHTCSIGNCHQNDDCASGACLGHRDPCAAPYADYADGIVGFYCATDEDECDGDTDCDETEYCLYSEEAGRWECHDPATLACADEDGMCGGEDMEIVSECGNGIVECGETCDDGDPDTCSIECNNTCSGRTPWPVCGNGIVECGETCDDGDTNPCSVGCNADCSGPSGEPECGNGILDCGEVCDDGDHDDCTPGCNSDCSGPGLLAYCGNGIVECGEICDDGERDSCSGDCNATCSGPAQPQTPQCGYTPPKPEGCGPGAPLYRVCVPCSAGDEIALALPATTALVNPLDGTWDLPPGLGMILRGLVPPGTIPPLLLGWQWNQSNTLGIIGALGIVYADPPEQDLHEPTLEISNPAYWGCNPYFDLQLEELEINIDGFVLSFTDLQITGRLDRNANMEEGTLSGIIDPAPLAEEFGLDPCALLPDACNADGDIEVLVTGLYGIGTLAQVIEVLPE